MTTSKKDRQTVIVLMGRDEERKKLVGTTLLGNSHAFLGTPKMNKHKPTSVFSPSSSSSSSSSSSPTQGIHLVWTPACNNKKEEKKSMKKVVEYLHEKVRFVNGFVLVLHGRELEERNYDLVLAYVKVYGTTLLQNLVVVVTESPSSPSSPSSSPSSSTSPFTSPTTMSTSSSASTISLPTITPAEHVQAWLDGIYPLLPPPSPSSSSSSPSPSSSSSSLLSLSLPFLFMHLNEDDNKEAFERGREIWHLIRSYPAIGCIGSDPSEKLTQKYQKKAKEKGMHQCKMCFRFFEPRLQQALAAADHSQSQVAVALERASAAAHLTLTSLNLSSLDKLVTEAEGAIAGGMEVVREVVAAGAVERAQEALSKGASKIGARVGAFAGGFVCTLVLPGAGTGIGRVVGGSAGSKGAKFLVSSCIDMVLGQNTCEPCHKAKKSSKAAKKGASKS